MDDFGSVVFSFLEDKDADLSRCPICPPLSLHAVFIVGVIGDLRELELQGRDWPGIWVRCTLLQNMFQVL